jgi:hypothetical protein
MATSPHLPKTDPNWQEEQDRLARLRQGGGGPAIEVPPPAGLTSRPSYYVAHNLAAATDKNSFAYIANAMLPFFSTQDQLSTATFLNTQDPNGLFKNYLGTQTTPNATTATDNPRAFSSAERAKQALAYLEAKKTASKLTDEQMGSGYKFLKEAIGLLQQLGANADLGELGMTRAEFENLQAKLEALTSQASADKTLAPYAELATKFINPTLIGTLFPKSTVNGQTVYGQSNKKLFT